MLAMIAGPCGYGVGITRAEALRGAASYGLAAAAGLSPAGAHAATTAFDGAILYDTRSASFLAADPQRQLRLALRDSADEPRVFFAGEEHTNKLHHGIQLEMVKAVDALDDSPTLIGLEMCWRQHQPALDAFVFGGPERGGGDIEVLARRTAWERTWGYPVELYAPILAYAREQKLRLVGLNAPYQVVEAVAKVGMEGLKPELRQLLPDVDLTNRNHRERFALAIGGRVGEDDALLPPIDDGAHGAMSPDGMQRMYEAMTLWDEFMASSIAGYVADKPKDGAGPFRSASLGTERMVVMVGSSHVRGRVGIPDRFTKRTNLSTFTMVPERWMGAGRPAGSAKLLPSEADWVLYARPQRAEGLSLVSSRRFSAGAVFL